ncbi:hypothetical protein EEL32_22780 [Brevibacillus laterosporus]|uniref:Uncharacterized protein n=1 Tax=Brevibacillus laterosporus TaxID=1465 RepID=A0A502HQH6_BRELA|nr:hypothetical protein [Brevibacillus laterosporus]QDX92697.1 hypothetical protein EEL30_10490 [Brevibacillus laterosporus]TPG71009.1 hypothetical protein EEL31_22970 [Brevibacillus laterosporus]TPG77049.1 hypothetical protein EEL32_22780 [Brevibacillus laterosporus]
MNKKALKWIIGSLALAVIVPTVAFMLIQELSFDKHDVNSFEQEEMQEVQLDEATKKELDGLREQVENGTLTQEEVMDKLGVQGFDSDGATK